jgi:hypothetical protein
MRRLVLEFIGNNMKTNKGSIKIKNVSGESYYIEEIDYTLEDQAIIDLLDETLDNYLDYASANRLLTECVNAKLYKDVKSEIINVVSNIPCRV